MRLWLCMIVMVVWVSIGVTPASAHANLLRADPLPNAILDQSPAEIRLGFTEPLEPQFSRILLRDQNGTILQTVPSQVNPDDPTEMVLSLTAGSLPDGVYTVVWRALSVADGHSTLGSFPIIVGQASGNIAASTQGSEAIPVDGTLIRWVNLLSLALGVGGLGFWLFVWTPAALEKQALAERRVHALIWLGWLLIGVTGFLLLLLQYSLATGEPLLTGVNGDSLNGLVANTRFGHLWLARMALWAGLGGALWFARSDRWFDWIALLIGAAILAINSVFSHANAAGDLTASVVADWLHLAAMVLWVGGLMQFVIVIIAVRRQSRTSTAALGQLVGYFSNFARVSVATLIVTGLYAAWLQIGSLDGLLTTPYGQALLFKLILIVPVIAIAAVNLVYTHRGLNNGKAIWEGRLRNLVGAEIALTTGMLLAVGIMTSIAPARSTLEQRATNPQPPQPQPIIETLTVNDLTMELTISPGWIGENTFTLKVTGSDNQPVNNASLIRMRFESQAQNLGESELRPTLNSGGIYTVSGANLSAPGEWRIRTTIQRPDQFDALADFKPQMTAAPQPVFTPPPPPGEPIPNRVWALLLAGILSLLVGGFFLGENRSQLLRASTLLSIGLLLVGGLFLVSALQPINTTVSAAADTFEPAPDAPIKLAVTSRSALPYLVTANGQLLQPGEDSQWQRFAPNLDAEIRDVYLDQQDTIWAATDQGLFAFRDGDWEQLGTLPSSRVVMTHGYLFALGDQGGIIRVPAGGAELEAPRDLKTPLADSSAIEFVMLGNHSHVLDIGGELYHTFDLGLSWELIPSAQPVDSISTDIDGNLLVAQENGVAIWNFAGSWGSTLPLPGGDESPILRTFAEGVYALGAGGLYRLAGNQWDTITLPDSDDAYLTALEFQYPRTLWVLDARGARLWATTDGSHWTMTPIGVQ